MAVEDLGVLGQALASVAALSELIGFNAVDLAALANLEVMVTLAQELITLAAQLASIGQSITEFSDGWVALGNGTFCSASVGRDWYGQAVQFTRTGAIRALQIQSLMGQAQQALMTLAHLVALIPIIAGTTSGAQMTSALIATTGSYLLRLQMSMLPAYQLMSAASLMEQVVAVSSFCLANNRLKGFGSY